MLNKITPDNIVILTKSFLALPINTMERLENTIDLIFEKVIYNIHHNYNCKKKYNI